MREFRYYRSPTQKNVVWVWNGNAFIKLYTFPIETVRAMRQPRESNVDNRLR